MRYTVYGIQSYDSMRNNTSDVCCLFVLPKCVAMIRCKMCMRWNEIFYFYFFIHLPDHWSLWSTNEWFNHIFIGILGRYGQQAIVECEWFLFTFENKYRIFAFLHLSADFLRICRFYCEQKNNQFSIIFFSQFRRLSNVFVGPLENSSFLLFFFSIYHKLNCHY